MTHQVNLPPDVERRLSAGAAETGQKIAQVIQAAVVRYVEDVDNGVPNGDGDWTDDKNARRCELIDKDIAGTITAVEHEELTQLERQAHEHFDRVAPPPIEGARR
ncbi:MAG: hypothetical protein ACRD2X_08870, partial [Vicinamibacteraceae bacterium]